MTNTSIALNMIRGTYLVGTDYTVGTMFNTTSETEVLTFNIPANTVSNGIIVTFGAAVDMNTSSDCSLKLKVGTDGSEDIYATIVFQDGSAGYQSGKLMALDSAGGTTDAADGNYKEYTFVVDDKDWTSAQTVSITMTMTDADGDNEALGHMLTVLGY